MIRRPTTSFRLLIAVIGCVLLRAGPAHVFGQGLDYVKANYTKYEYRIPMRDGVRSLHGGLCSQGSIAALSDHAVANARTASSPTALTRTSRDLGPSPLFGKDGYIVVYQDVRGRWMSEGEFVNMRPHRDAEERPARDR